MKNTNPDFNLTSKIRLHPATIELLVSKIASNIKDGFKDFIKAENLKLYQNGDLILVYRQGMPIKDLRGPTFEYAVKVIRNYTGSQRMKVLRLDNGIRFYLTYNELLNSQFKQPNGIGHDCSYKNYYI